MSFSGSAILEDRMTRLKGREDTMPARAYILTLSLFIAGGLALAAFMASLTYNMQSTLWWLLPYFGLSIPGIILSMKSDHWPLSTLGYVMVIVPTGAIIGPYVHLYKMESVLEVAVVTMGVSLTIGIMGAIYPKSVEHWGGFLLTALIILIVGDLAQAFMPAFGLQPTALALWDWIGVFLFSAFIFYDMNRAMRMPYTLDNAVDNAVALYLDIINLFIRFLSIIGEKDSD